MRVTFLGLLLAAFGCARGDALAEALAKLDDPRAEVRGDAVWELAKERDPRAAQALARALEDGSADVRLSAAMALHDSDWDGPEVLRALSRAAHDSDPQVRQYSIMALSRIADPSTLQVLHQAKLDPDAEVRREAVDAIQSVDAALQARSVRYHPPASIPLVLMAEQAKVYLRAHETEWTFTVSRVSDEEMTGRTLSIVTGTICERPEIETKGAYHGQSDAVAFLRALHRRVKRDPQALEEFRAFRSELLKRQPVPKEPDSDK